ncbi:helix-turn-helix domain-containing protein [Patescibacteria group bacterium]|nr:helix-turn-helix domain-containing protein [Patescibacteria group bacterium]
MQNSEMDNNYISLHEAAKLTNYSQDYISLLCRQKKLQGIKLGRNWVTTKEWVEKYINKTKGSGGIVIPVKINIEKKIKLEKKIDLKENTCHQKKTERRDVGSQIELGKNLGSIKPYQSQMKFSFTDNIIFVSFLVVFIIANLMIFNLYSSVLNRSLLEYSQTAQGSKNLQNLSSLIAKDLKLENIFQDEKGRVAGASDSKEE